MEMGHNNPPAKYELREHIEKLRTEIENWLDGTRVESDGQMQAVDALIHTTKDLDRRMKAEKEIEWRPHKIAGDAVIAEYKDDLDELAGWTKGLLSIVGGYKIEQQRIKDAAAADARRAAQEAARLAQMADESADYGNLAERREADQAALQARIADMEAQHARNDKVGGLRTVRRAVVIDYKAMINHIARNDRDAIAAFCDEWLKKQFRAGEVIPDCAKIISEKVAI